MIPLALLATGLGIAFIIVATVEYRDWRERRKRVTVDELLAEVSAVHEPLPVVIFIDWYNPFVPHLESM